MPGMLEALGWVAREARVGAGLRQIDIATAIIAAYEYECELGPGMLWRRAVDRAFGR